LEVVLLKNKILKWIQAKDSMQILVKECLPLTMSIVVLGVVIWLLN
jgi:hypothetical protein